MSAACFPHPCLRLSLFLLYDTKQPLEQLRCKYTLASIFPRDLKCQQFVFQELTDTKL